MAFKKGNPGRPKGSKNRKLELLRSNDERLQKKILEMALSGDIGALKIVADRLWPRLRAQAEFVEIDIESDDISIRARKLFNATLTGQISADILRDLLTALYGEAKIIELAEFEERIKSLEQHHDIAPWESDYKPVQRLTDQKLLPLRGKQKRLKNETGNRKTTRLD